MILYINDVSCCRLMDLDCGNATCNITASDATLRQHDQHHLSPSAGQGKLRVAIHGYGGLGDATCYVDGKLVGFLGSNVVAACMHLQRKSSSWQYVVS